VRGVGLVRRVGLVLEGWFSDEGLVREGWFSKGVMVLC
jgi:hypothetical protein